MEVAQKEAKRMENKGQSDYLPIDNKVDKIRAKAPKRSGNGGPSKRTPAYQKSATQQNPNHAPKQGHQRNAIIVEVISHTDLSVRQQV